jgi:hypothetical protein
MRRKNKENNIVFLCPSSITSPRSSNVTLIGCGNAAGNFVPPYVFPGKR